MAKCRTDPVHKNIFVVNNEIFIMSCDMHFDITYLSLDDIAMLLNLIKLNVN